MSDKQDMIVRMMELQKKFIELDQNEGVTQKDFYTAEEGTFLHNFRIEYMELVDKVINCAHDEVGSVRD